MSWLSRIFGSADREPTSLDIVSEYGSVLETAQRGWSGLFDMTDLPFEKTRIKKRMIGERALADLAAWAG